jgi:hypothetical protein
VKKNVTIVVAMICFLVFVLVADSFAQRGMRGRGSGGWGMETPYGRMYNPKTVETLVGEVITVGRITPNRRMSYGVYIIVKTEKETVSVHLGPGWFIDNQDIKMKLEDRVEVKGSRIFFRGKRAIIAAVVKRGNETLELRNESGFPVWSGWGQR